MAANLYKTFNYCLRGLQTAVTRKSGFGIYQETSDILRGHSDVQTDINSAMSRETYGIVICPIKEFYIFQQEYCVFLIRIF